MLVPVKLDCYSLLPLSLVSLGRNRTRGPEIHQSLLGIWYEICPLQTDGGLCMPVCVWLYGCGVCLSVRLFTYGVIVSVWWSQRIDAGSVRHCTKSWPCRNSMLYPHLKASSGSCCHVVLTVVVSIYVLELLCVDVFLHEWCHKKKKSILFQFLEPHWFTNPSLHSK